MGPLTPRCKKPNELISIVEGRYAIYRIKVDALRKSVATVIIGKMFVAAADCVKCIIVERVRSNCPSTALQPVEMSGFLD